MLDSEFDKIGIKNPLKILHNPTYEDLYIEETLPNLKGLEKVQQTEFGAVNVLTGIFTGRSPKDRFIVNDKITKNSVWWGDINIPFDEENFDKLHKKVIEYLIYGNEFIMHQSITNYEKCKKYYIYLTKYIEI